MELAKTRPPLSFCRSRDGQQRALVPQALRGNWKLRLLVFQGILLTESKKHLNWTSVAVIDIMTKRDSMGKADLAYRFQSIIEGVKAGA